MRISDWSSDVCSSDLPLRDQEGAGKVGQRTALLLRQFERMDQAQPVDDAVRDLGGDDLLLQRVGGDGVGFLLPHRGREGLGQFGVHAGVGGKVSMLDGRSEEHTSELQSLMRISYAVFCLKKKNTKSTTQ